MISKARVKRCLILFIILPVAVVSVICYYKHQQAIEDAAARSEKLKQQSTLEPVEENTVNETLAASAAKTDLALWEMNNDWKTGNTLIDAETERTRSNSFYQEELEKIANPKTNSAAATR